MEGSGAGGLGAGGALGPSPAPCTAPTAAAIGALMGPPGTAPPATAQGHTARPRQPGTWHSLCHIAWAQLSLASGHAPFCSLELSPGGWCCSQEPHVTLSWVLPAQAHAPLGRAGSVHAGPSPVQHTVPASGTSPQVAARVAYGFRKVHSPAWHRAGPHPRQTA